MFRAGEKAKALASKLDSLITRTHIEKDRTDSYKLSSKQRI